MTKSKYSTSNVSQTIDDAEYLDLVNRAQFLNYTCNSNITFYQNVSIIEITKIRF